MPLLSLTFVLLLQTRFQSPGCTAGQPWEFRPTEAQLNSSPRWKQGDDNPPLSPRAAERAARSLLQQLKCESAADWELHQIALQPVSGMQNVWIYLVEFSQALGIRKNTAVGSSLPRVVDVVVLFNGKAVVPAQPAWPPK
jgi:hypothetical protein